MKLTRQRDERVTMSRPNFLFMIADDHRHSALGALGSEAVSTPVFDQMIAEGMCFNQAHIMGLDIGRGFACPAAAC